MPVYRSQMVQRLTTSSLDLLVVGGGISGAGVAQAAAMRGLKTALVEKGDFGIGTSHASTKLLHGGLRYLEQFQFRLMYEALHERNRLTRLASHLAEWLPFLIPLYEGGWKKVRLGIGLTLYDLLAGLPRGRLHRWITAGEALAMAPFLKPDGLRGAWLYYDCRTNDTRLTMDVIKPAMEAGAIAVNYCMVTGLIKQDGRIAGATVCDTLTGVPFPVSARCVVNATGPWTDQVLALDQSGPPRLSPSKGIHVLVPAEKLPVSAAVLAPSPRADGRFVFVVPWEGATLIGTTDTPYSGDPDLVTAELPEIDYVLEAANAACPGARLDRSRPDHHCRGKLTTYRTMAAEVVEMALNHLGLPVSPCRTGNAQLGASRARANADLVRSDPDLGHPLVPGLPYTRAEVVYAACEELAVLPEDVLARRTRITLLDRERGERHRAEIGAL